MPSPAAEGLPLGYLGDDGLGLGKGMSGLGCFPFVEVSLGELEQLHGGFELWRHWEGSRRLPDLFSPAAASSPPSAQVPIDGPVDACPQCMLWWVAPDWKGEVIARRVAQVELKASCCGRRRLS